MNAPARHPAHRRATRRLVQGALISLAVTLAVGLAAALYHHPASSAVLEGWGVDLRHLRPLHTVFGAAWIILGALAVLARDLEDHGVGEERVIRRRWRAVVLCFGVAGLGIALTVPVGVTSGREYVGFHPVFALPIAVGWLLICATWFQVHWRGLWDQPVHRIMWASGLLLFAWTFAEQHAWLLPGVFSDPIVDRRLQWKACGTLVGAFNFLVYGGLVWLGDRLSGDGRYGRSRLAWSLWLVSCANTLFNYVHHTYHLPQSHGLKWWGFAVSMTEIVLLVKTASDVAALARTRHTLTCAARHLLASVKGWTLFMLVTSVVIAIPPVNALIHGTWLVAGHAMGGMVGIDTMAVLAFVAVLLAEDHPAAAAWLERRRTIAWVWATNGAVLALVVWLHALGAVDGVLRYQAPSGGGFAHRPDWLVEALPLGLVGFGGLAVVGFGVLLVGLLPLAFAQPPQPEVASASRSASR